MIKPFRTWRGWRDGHMMMFAFMDETGTTNGEYVILDVHTATGTALIVRRFEFQEDAFIAWNAYVKNSNVFDLNPEPVWLILTGDMH